MPSLPLATLEFHRRLLNSNQICCGCGFAVRTSLLGWLNWLWHADITPIMPNSLADSIRFNLERRRISRSVLEAVRLFCQLDEPSLKDQQLALQTGENANTSVAVVGASELARRRVPEAFTVLAQLARSPDFARSFGMRRAVVNAAANYSTPEAVEFLIEILANHDGLLRYETARHLARLTKQNFGGYPQRWRDW
ncbi:MAG: hypothetical protein ACI93T_000075 [Porticoccaceae bacterium]